MSKTETTEMKPSDSMKRILKEPLLHFLVLGALLFTTGCRVLKSTAELPGKAVQTVTHGKKDQPVVDPVELQHQLMRLADEFTAGMAATSEQLRRGTNALDRI